MFNCRIVYGIIWYCEIIEEYEFSREGYVFVLFCIKSFFKCEVVSSEGIL